MPINVYKQNKSHIIFVNFNVFSDLRPLFFVFAVNSFLSFFTAYVFYFFLYFIILNLTLWLIFKRINI